MLQSILERYSWLLLCRLLVAQAAHGKLFPIDYDDGFFHKATNGLDR